VSEIDPADVTAGGSGETPEEFDEEIEGGGARLRKPLREGLPAGYRMRADAHYVDQLSSRRAERPADARERRADRAFAQLTEDVASIESAAAVLAADVSPMTRRANVDVIVAQAWRAAWLLRAMAVLDSTHRAHPRSRQLGFILGDVCDRLAAECRLTGFTVQMHASDWNAGVIVDESAIVTGLTGAVFSTLGLIGRTDGVTIQLSASASAGELRSVDVTQDEVMVGPSIASRFFDPLWAERPGGWIAGLGASAARAVAQQQGGSAAFLAGERRGTTVRLSFLPAA
jgi:nitrogen-specific signal transduction histidine kinase